MGKKTTKRALVSSVLALLLCLTMLIGSTYAWFTDSVTSGINNIVAGNLDIELEYLKNANKPRLITTDASKAPLAIFSRSRYFSINGCSGAITMKVTPNKVSGRVV